MRTYSQNRDRIAEYFDKTGFRAWEALTTETPVSKIRLKVRESREKMRSRMLLHLPNDLSGKRILEDWNKEISVGLTGAFLCSKIFGEIMG